MRAVKGRDTKPELLVRRLLRGIAPGYRLCRRDLPGAPDICYIGRKKAIFVHGCFWHGHDCKRAPARQRPTRSIGGEKSPAIFSAMRRISKAMPRWAGRC